MLNKIAKRNMKGIVPLYYDMKKASPSIITPEILYNGMITAYTTGNIGIYSNNISKIWNSTGEIDKQELDAVKWLVMENNFVIKFSHLIW